MRLGFLGLMGAAFAEAYANKGAFWSKVLLMASNNAVWAVFYTVLFNKTGDISGWTIDDMMLLFASLTLAFGMAIGFGDNARRLGNLIADGSIDSALTLPVSPLRYLVFRRVEPVALGDGFFGIILFLVLGHPNPEKALLFIVASFLGAVIMSSFLVAASSLTFFLKGRGEHVDLVFNAMVVFANYPTDIYSGVMKLVLFSAFPVAFFGTVPASLMRDFNLGLFALFATLAVAFALAARTLFYVGLRRYRSGALWVGA